MTQTEGRITIEDLQRKALRVRDMAETEARRVLKERRAHLVVATAVAVAVAVSVAYQMGRRRCQAR